MFICHGLYRLLTSLLSYSRFEEPAKLILLFKRFISPGKFRPEQNKPTIEFQEAVFFLSLEGEI